MLVIGRDGKLEPCLELTIVGLRAWFPEQATSSPAFYSTAARTRPIAPAVRAVGKVFCKVDADFAPIETGDLLTSSATPGHAMKASDPQRAFGAVIRQGAPTPRRRPRASADPDLTPGISSLREDGMSNLSDISTHWPCRGGRRQAGGNFDRLARLRLRRGERRGRFDRPLRISNDQVSAELQQLQTAIQKGFSSLQLQQAAAEIIAANNSLAPPWRRRRPSWINSRPTFCNIRLSPMTTSCKYRPLSRRGEPARSGNEMADCLQGRGLCRRCRTYRPMAAVRLYPAAEFRRHGVHRSLQHGLTSCKS